MLLHQAAAQVRLMTGAEAPVEEMAAALRAAAPGSGV
jgi:shikimate 5-dehydrogenase